MIHLWSKPQAEPKKTASQYILGLSVSSGGSSAAMVSDGKIIFTGFEPPPEGGGRPRFPAALIAAALEKSSEAEGTILGVRDMAAVAFCGKPLREYEFYRRSWLAAAPGGFSRYMRTAPAAYDKKRLAEGHLRAELAAASWGEQPTLILYPAQQLSAAASAFYPSPFEDAAILVLDGDCEGPAASICLGSGEKIKLLRELSWPDSPQLLSGALTAWAGFGPESSWELFTAPAPADRRGADAALARIWKDLAELKEDGSLRLNPAYFLRGEGMRPDGARWRELFGRGPFTGEPLAGARLDFIAAARAALEELVFRLGAQAKRLAFSSTLCLCAPPELKLAAEGKLKASGIFSTVWAQPYPAPQASATGAALAARYVYFGAKRAQAQALAWGERPRQELPEEAEAPLKASPPRPLSAAERAAYGLRFWLSVAPAAARRARPAGTEAPRASFYEVRQRLYAREDLEGAG